MGVGSGHVCDLVVGCRPTRCDVLWETSETHLWTAVKVGIST